MKPCRETSLHCFFASKSTEKQPENQSGNHHFKRFCNEKCEKYPSYSRFGAGIE